MDFRVLRPPPKESEAIITLQVSQQQKTELMEWISGREWNKDAVLGVVEYDGSLEEIKVTPRKPMEREKEGSEICEHCYCAPCVTDITNKQQWWPEADSEPKIGNNVKRKNIYYKFWTMLYHRGVWNFPQYILKKQNMLSTATRLSGKTVRREIMPDCVMGMVRRWYPNIDGQPYMGHRWS